MIVSAQDVCRTRLCRAQDCELEADAYSPWCFRCAKKPDAKPHTTPPPPRDQKRKPEKKRTRTPQEKAAAVARNRRRRQALREQQA